jgi:hypothetical protein
MAAMMPAAQPALRAGSMEPMNRTILAGGIALLALFVLVGCGSSGVPTPDSPSSTSTSAPSSVGVSPATETSSAVVPSGAPDGGPAIPAPLVGGTSSAAAPAVSAPPAGSTAEATRAYAARFCTALSPLVAFKQQNETPNMASVTNGQQAKDLAVRPLTEGIDSAQTAVRAVTDLGPAPDSQASAGINGLLASLQQGIKVGQELLPQAQAVDPNNPMALIALAGQAKAQMGTSQTTGLDALRTSTGPALAAALHTAPECAPLGV